MRWIAVVAWLSLAAGTAQAIEIDGKWGLGVGARGILGTDPEVAIFRGHSARTGWLLDFSLSGFDQTSRLHYSTSDTGVTVPRDQTPKGNGEFVSVGPRIRRFTRPASDFSPYWDLYLHGGLNHNHRSQGEFTNDSRSYGVDMGAAVGVEYFTRWHFSVAAHTGVASVDWSHFRVEEKGPGFTRVETGRQAGAAFHVAPVLYLRAYF